MYWLVMDGQDGRDCAGVAPKADGGAVRFDYPASWVYDEDADHAVLRDRARPDDRIVLEVSYLRLPPDLPGGGFDDGVRTACRTYKGEPGRQLSPREHQTCISDECAPA